MKGIAGKIAMITGAAEGIGFAISGKLSDEGAHTVLTDVSEGVFDSFKRLHRSYPRNDGFAEVMNVTDKSQITKVVNNVIDKLGKIDILINNAGVLPQVMFLETTEEIWDQAMNVNAKGVLLCSQAVLPDMIRRRDGIIVNTASAAGKCAEPGIPAYSASKAAVIRLTQAMAHEFVQDNIRVNCVCPGATDTEMLGRVFRDRSNVMGLTPDQMKENIYNQIPMKKMARPEDIANVVVFLVSDESSYMTGQAINVTGGRVWY
jgi:meso-butanediol dehydrogenase / (S,S)-butanediol dehydrogenase / diacetyl reductase